MVEKERKKLEQKRGRFRPRAKSAPFLLQFFSFFPNHILPNFSYHSKIDSDNFAKKQALPCFTIFFSKLLLPRQNTSLYFSSDHESDCEIQPLLYLSRFECFTFRLCISLNSPSLLQSPRWSFISGKCTALINSFLHSNEHSNGLGHVRAYCLREPASIAAFGRYLPR